MRTVVQISISLAVLAAALPAQRQSTTLGERAPEWRVKEWLQLPAGKKTLRLADFKGKVVYLYCFQSWCPGCHSHGFPTLKKLSDEFAKNKDVGFVAVQTVFEGFHANTLDAATKVAKKFDLKIPFGHDVGPKGKRSTLMRDYHTRGTPWTIMIDRSGKVRFADFSLTVRRGRKLLNKLLAEKPKTLTGSKIDLSLDWVARPKARRRLTLYRWWTTGCEHCTTTIPALVALQKKYGSNGFGVVPVYHRKSDNNHSDAKLTEQLKKLGYQGPHARDEGWRNLRRIQELASSELDRFTSISILVDDQGRVRWVHPGPRIHPSKGGKHRQADASHKALTKLLDRILLVPTRKPKKNKKGEI